MSNAPELPAELFAQLWGEALQRHPDASVHRCPAGAEVARLAYAAGWETRGAVKECLTTPEESSAVGAPPADPIRAALERLVELERGNWSTAGWGTNLALALAAARTVLEAAPPDGQRGGQEMAPPPADGDVAELVALVGIAAGVCAHEGYHDEAQACRRAAAELEQLSLGGWIVPSVEQVAQALQPVPVGERPWELDDWCDEQGRCWMGDPGGGIFIRSQWLLCRPEDAPRMRVSLPAYALPPPSGEATNG